MAVCLTSMNPKLVLAAPIVADVAPSNAYGTSTPGVFRPSALTNSTWYRVIVTRLFEDGVVGQVGVALERAFGVAGERPAGF